MNDLELFALNEAAKQLSLSVWTLIAHSRRGSLRTVKCGRRRSVPRAEIERISREDFPR